MVHTTNQRVLRSILGIIITAVFIVPHFALADSIPTASSSFTKVFACSDDSRDLNIGNNTNPAKTKYIGCKSGAVINETSYEENKVIISVVASCSGGLSSIILSANESKRLDVYCKKRTGSDANGVPQYSKDSQVLPTLSGLSVKNNEKAKSITTGAGIKSGGLPVIADTQGAFKKLLNTFFGVLAAIAVLIVAIGGMRYVFANGDPAQVTQAKNTILYALVGLAVALSGYSIVTFVIKNI